MRFYRPLPPHMAHKWTLLETVWVCRVNIIWNLKTWWMDHRPISWSDTLVSLALMGITVGFLMFLIGLAIFGFMVTDCGL